MISKRKQREENLKKILEQYAEQELKLYDKYDKMPPHKFSDEYREKMRLLVEQSVQRKRPTFVYRLTSVCACIIVALLIVNQASAYVFGMSLWDKLMEPAPQEMVTTIYQGKESGRNKKGGGETAGKERVHDIPTEVPEGYELVNEGNGNDGIFVRWQFGDKSQVSFSSIEINQDVHIYENREWETEEMVVIAGYQGRFYVNKTHSYLYWEDEKYRNSIQAINVLKEQLLAVAESLYKE